MRGALLTVCGCLALTAAWLYNYAGRVTRPAWWRRVELRRELRGLDEYRHRIRRTSIDAATAYREGDPDAGRELTACALLLDSCDRHIDAALDQLRTLTR